MNVKSKTSTNNPNWTYVIEVQKATKKWKKLTSVLWSKGTINCELMLHKQSHNRQIILDKMVITHMCII